MIRIILFIGLAVRLFGLNQSFWLDEAAQVIESARPFSEQLNISADFWPPLYHLLLHVWMYAGKSEVWIRLLSVGFAVTTIGFVYRLTKELTSEKIGLLTAFLFATAPFHVWYSQESRPYVLATLLAVASTYFLIRQNRLSYLVTAVLFLFSSYFAPFMLMTHGAYVWGFQKKWGHDWVKSICISVLLFLPWMPSFFNQLTVGRGLTSALPGWSDAVSTPLVKSLPLVFAKFMLGRVSFDDKIFYAALVMGLLILFVYTTYKAYRSNKTIVLKIGLLGGLPILLAFLVSMLLPILAPQRVLFSLPFLYILIALGATALKKYYWLPVTLLLVINLHSLYLYNTNPRFQREQWRQAISFVEETRTSRSLAVFVFPDAFAPWQWYSRDVVNSVSVASHFVVKEVDLDSYRLRLLSADKLYYFHYLTDLTDPKKLVPSFLQRLGFYEISIRDFPGVGFVTIYEKALAAR